MQSLNPRRGQMSRLGSQDALLARGIAAPRGSRCLPALTGVRSVLRRSPKAVRLGRLGPDRMRGKWLVLCVFFLATAVAYGAWIGGQTSKIFGLFTGGVEHLAVAAGFGAKRVTVEGQLHATDADITAALQAGPNTMMLGFDSDAAKARLEAVPWIRHAQVMRFLPSTLRVVIEERSPYAVWQKEGQTFIVDDEGVVLTRALRDAYPDLKEKMLGAIRVGDRRWTLKLKSGVEVMLPDDNVDEALASLTKLEQEQGVLERDIAAVDLRLLDRITVRLHETASAAPSDGANPEDQPTASTKGTRAKGKT